MPEISTHILDTAQGCPAAGVKVTLSQWDANRWRKFKQSYDRRERADLRLATRHDAR